MQTSKNQGLFGKGLQTNPITWELFIVCNGFNMAKFGMILSGGIQSHREIF